uniref:VPS9 domain-containing protein n=1 Tax=Hymenolepis diminuta TaxID=6216 RepID=A0A0R3SJJ3_HYMDI
LFTDFSSVRVSLIAAPKTDALNFENNFIDAGSNASNSSRASTVFSYPWDLPPPQSDHSSSSATPPCPLKWATLQRHLSEYENQSKHRDSTLRANSVELRDSAGSEINDKQLKNGLFKLPTVLLNEVDIDPIERANDDKTSSGDEQFFEILSDNPNTLDDESSYREVKEHLSQPTTREEGPYDTIGDDSPSCDRILEGVSEKDVPSPCVDISTPASIESSQNQSSQQYVYAEVKLSSDTSTSSSLAFHTPPIPTHPSKSKVKTISSEIQVYDEIGNKREQVKAKEISFDLPSSTSISSASIDPPNTSEGKSESRSSVTELGKHLERFVCGLANDKNSAFCKHVSTFIDCTIKQLGDNPQKTLQNVRQFMDGVTNFLQTSHETELQEAIDAERRDLRGLQYLDVAQELEELIQVAVLRPLHRKLIENLQTHGYGTISPESAEEFTNVVKKEYQNIPNLTEMERRRLENQLFEPVKRIYAQLSRSFRPTDKLNHLVDIFQRIDSQISFSLSSGQLSDSSNTTKLTVYAIVLALADLLKPPKRISTKTRNQKGEGKHSDISRIEVHRLYLEALISPACLASSAEGCRRLTDLICLLRYIDNFNRCGSPASAIRMLYLRQIQSTELEEIPWSPNLYKLRRSFTDNIQEALQRSTNVTLTTGSFSPPSWKELIRNRKDREGSVKTSSSTSFSGSSFVVLAANESKKTLIPFEVPLRSSLTVRELCNMLALKLTVFDSKDFTLFFHSASADIPMSDNLHLEPFLTQNYGEECASSVGSLGSIDSFCENSSQPSTPKMSNIRRLFRRRKRIASSDSSLRWLESPKPSRRRLIDGQDKERRPSIDWSSLGRRNPCFVLIYRRRSDDVVLYASNLFECLPTAGKLI